MNETTYWSPGDHVVLRYVGHDNGWAAGWPQIIVEDTPDRVMLYQPAGTRAQNARGVGEDRRSRLMPGSRLDWPELYSLPLGLLRIMRADATHGVEVYFGAGDTTPPQYGWLDDEGHHRGFKVNLQARFVRTSIGFDTTDNALDVVMGTDLNWRWKDEEQVADRVGVGLTFPEEAAAFRAEGERVIADLERRAFPFDQPWDEWRPDPAWTPPTLPEGWVGVEGVSTDLNRERPD
jgi:hypothetical protein